MNAKAKNGSKNKNHPLKGSTIKVEPIRDLKAIKRIKKLRDDEPRNLCLFTLGINTAYRANELLSLKVGQVDYLCPGDRLEIRESKTGKTRSVVVNKTVVQTIDQWLRQHPNPESENSLFQSRKHNSPLTVPSVCNMIKLWCSEIGLRGNYGSHTLRKTWGYHQLRNNPNTSAHLILPLLMEAYGHATQRQTLEYLCIESNEIHDLYALEL